jgi:hypothetical protein
MIYKTYAQISSEIDQELDLVGETFIDPLEKIGYVNDAIQEAAAHIHKLNAEDEYFLTYEDIDLEQGESLYDMPTSIYANKIKKIVYIENQLVYEVTRLKKKDRFIDQALINQETGQNVLYRYMLLNNSADEGIQISLSPMAQSSNGKLRVWHIRTPNLVVDDDSKIDIPQFYMFIKQFAKWRVCAKETHPNTSMEYAELDRIRNLMIATLENMVMDEDNMIEMDLSHYEESV